MNNIDLGIDYVVKIERINYTDEQIQSLTSALEGEVFKELQILKSAGGGIDTSFVEYIIEDKIREILEDMPPFNIEVEING